MRPGCAGAGRLRGSVVPQPAGAQPAASCDPGSLAAHGHAAFAFRPPMPVLRTTKASSTARRCLVSCPLGGDFSEADASGRGMVLQRKARTPCYVVKQSFTALATVNRL